MHTLFLKKLIKTYAGKRVVDSVDIAIKSGQVTGLLGPNGAGKTTTFYMVIGIVKPDKGQILYDEKDITEYPMHIRARKGISYLPQEPSVFKKLSVMDNLMIVLETLELSQKERKDRAYKLLREFGIKHLADRKAGVLSGGERRRLEITRSLAINPSFILLDEPFAGIDPLAVADIKEIIKHLVEKGIGILISDHNVRETLNVCDTAYILNDGKVIEEGDPQKIAASPLARKIYLGEEFEL